jgi:HlyD family secretion protein
MNRRITEFLHRLWALFEPRQTLDLDILEFHADQVELERRPLPPVMRSMLYCVVFIVAAALVWSFIAQVDRIVAAEGRLVPMAQTIKVQPLENAIIKKFEVEIGQTVKAGQVLVRLDPTFAKADETRLMARERTLGVHIARLEAELGKADFINSGGAMDGEEFALQHTLFLGRNAEYANRAKSFDNALSELAIAVASLEKQHAESVAQLAILAEIQTIYKRLSEQGHESRVAFLNAQFQHASKLSEATRLKNEIEEKKQAIGRVRAEKDAFSSKWNNEILVELTGLRKDRDAIREDVSKASRLHDLSVLTAPEPGVVLELGPFSVGSVARVGEPVMVLVPLDVPLEAEIFVDPGEIGYIRSGDNCRLKLETFPFQKHGVLEGVLRTIGHDSVRSEGSETPKYKARVELTNTRLAGVPEDFRLMPGMSLRAEVKVGTRRVISFFTYPLIRTLDEGLRDP